MRATSTFPRARIAAAASFGTCPVSASDSVAASSTSSHLPNLLASLQTRPISSRVYLEINAISLSAALPLRLLFHHIVSEVAWSAAALLPLFRPVRQKASSEAQLR